LLTDGQKDFPTKINIHNKYTATAMDGNNNFLAQIGNKYSFLAVTRQKDFPTYMQTKPPLFVASVITSYKNGYKEFIPLHTALRFTLALKTGTIFFLESLEISI